MNALAIDLGTTAAKVSVISDTGAILGSGIAGVTTVFASGGHAEQDAEAVWQAVLSAACQALHGAGPKSVAEVKVVCATSQWSSIVPVNANGLPVGPMMTWMDHRGGRYQKALTAGPSGSEADAHAAQAHWAAVHGLHPSTSLGHMLFLQNEQTKLHDRVAAYLEPMDYLNARLCGILAATGCTAMPLALTDNRTLGDVRWSADLIARSGIDASKLPEIVPSLTVLGPLLAGVATALGVPKDAVVVAGANDSVAAALGTAALSPGQATVVMGTTGVLTAHHPRRVVDASKFIVTMPSALSDRYYVMAEAGLGGKVLEVFLQEMLSEMVQGANGSTGNPNPDDGFNRMSGEVAHVPAGSDGLMFLPWLLGSAAPRVDGRQRGAFLGLSLHTTRAHMLRAVLEGIAMQMRWLTDEVEETLGTTVPMVRFAGGGAQSDVWSQTMADVLGRSVEQLREPRHANARGAGLLGFLSLGLIGVDDLASIVPIRRRYEPIRAHTALFNDRMQIYRDLHEQLGSTFAKLSSQ